MQVQWVISCVAPGSHLKHLRQPFSDKMPGALYEVTEGHSITFRCGPDVWEVNSSASLYQFFVAAVANYCRLKRNLLSHSSGTEKSKIKSNWISSFCRLPGRIPSMALSLTLMTGGNPWSSSVCGYTDSNLYFHGHTTSSMCYSVFCLLQEHLPLDLH